MKRRRIKKRFYLFVLLVICAILFVRSDLLAPLLYPVHFKDNIRISAKNYNLEPQLVAAIIRSESNFKTGLESRKGAVGLMQVMPSTAEWVVQKAGFEKISMDMLRNRADVSIEVGAWYLRSLVEQFDNNKIAAIAAYNAGPGNVRKWLNTGVWDGTIDQVDQIPFGETKRYVQKVHYYYNKYVELYPSM